MVKKMFVGAAAALALVIIATFARTEQKAGPAPAAGNQVGRYQMAVINEYTAVQPYETRQKKKRFYRTPVTYLLDTQTGQILKFVPYKEDFATGMYQNTTKDFRDAGYYLFYRWEELPEAGLVPDKFYNPVDSYPK